MKQIRKYVLGGQDTVRIQRDFQFLSAQPQQGRLTMWAIVDTAEAEVLLPVYAVYTGGCMPVGEYIATTQYHNGALVLHTFIDRNTCVDANIS